jgi:hypothetical protein
MWHWQQSGQVVLLSDEFGNESHFFYRIDINRGSERIRQDEGECGDFRLNDVRGEYDVYNVQD